MIQFFEIFKADYIERLIALNKIYLVTQTYSGKYHAVFENKKTILLISDYEDWVLANTHRDALETDPYRSVIQLTNKKHLNKLQQMLMEDSPYMLYWSVVKKLEEFKKRLNLKYKDNLRRYIMKNTDWSIGAGESIKPHVQLIFGELFIILRYRKHELRVRFAEIEKS
ncbi:MAG: hypothetical protein ABI402_00370 [Ferruginibacter sp.]